MSAPSDGARADARKARAAQVEEGHDGRCEREYTANGFIFIDCLCSVRRAKAEAWDEGFDAGERDVFRHRELNDWSTECIRNPYRSEAIQ